MSNRTSVGFIGVFCLLTNLCLGAQISARLHNADTQLTLEAGETAPSLTDLTVPGQPQWTNTNSESLIGFAEISRKQIPCNWILNRDASKVSEQRVVFVYDTASPHLRLSWEWRVREAF